MYVFTVHINLVSQKWTILLMIYFGLQIGLFLMQHDFNENSNKQKSTLTPLYAADRI